MLLTSEENTEPDAILRKTLEQDILKASMDEDVVEVGVGLALPNHFSSTLKSLPQNWKSTTHITEEMIPIELVDSEEDDNVDDTNAEDKHEESDSNNSDHNVDDDSKCSHLDDDNDLSDLWSENK